MALAAKDDTLPNLRRGYVISCAIHAALFGVAFFATTGAVDYEDFDFDKVTVIDAERYDAIIAQSRLGVASEDDATPSAEFAETETEATRTIPPEDAPAPDVEIEPEIPAAPLPEPDPVVEAPQDIPQDAPEDVPVDPPQPDIAETPPAPSIPEAPTPDVQPLPEVDSAEISGIATPDSTGTERAETATDTAPDLPREAPIITDDAQIEDESLPVAENAAPQFDDNDQLADDVIESEAATEEASADSLALDAAPDTAISAAPAVSPLTQTPPGVRPDDLSAPQPPVAEPQIVQTLDDPARIEPPIAEIAEATPVPETAPEPIPEVDEQAAIDDLLAGILDEETTPAASPAIPEGRGFTAQEAAAIGQRIGQFWSNTLIREKPNFERLTVVLRVPLYRNGQVYGPITLVSPQNPDADFDLAFRAARDAILAAQPIPLPLDIFNDGDMLTLKFDPRNGVGFN